jgi:uncharacterized OB-fold protein
MTKTPGAGAESMWAPYDLEYPYKRSVGPVLGRFFGGLKHRRFEAVRTADGRVICPPLDYDPESGEALGAEGDWTQVGPGGVVKTWSWVPVPRAKHPLQRPFAWALIQLDGASTSLLHVIDAESESELETGMRVIPRWRGQTVGDIRDIECFVAEDSR